jgi:signal recognition particle receptor subunit beta
LPIPKAALSLMSARDGMVDGRDERDFRSEEKKMVSLFAVRPCRTPVLVACSTVERCIVKPLKKHG